MKSDLLKIETIQQCDCQFNKSSLHPLINVVDLTGCDMCSIDKKQIAYYAILYKECNCKCYGYGHLSYDFSDGLLSFYAPGDTINIKGKSASRDFKTKMLLFHPDLFSGTFLETSIANYNFFSYNENEALHISLREKIIIQDIMGNIMNELDHSIDTHSKIIHSKYIELLLEYCSRFYDRQFTMREQVNKRILNKFNKIIDAYFEKKDRESLLFLSSENCANLFNLSPAYFKDLLWHETGHHFEEYIENKRFEIAKKWLMTTNKSIQNIVDELKYDNTQRFIIMFEKMIGCSPSDFRNKN